MSDIYQDPTTKELALVNNDLSIVDGVKAIRQDLEQTLKFFYGEWFLDTTQGIPYYQLILVKDPDLNTIQALIQNAICAVNGVMELTHFEFNYDNPSRQLSIAFSVRTTDGIINYSQTLEASV